MPMTRQQKHDALKHLFTVVFDQDEDSILFKIAKDNAITSPHDLIALPKVDLELLDYRDDTGERCTITRGHAGLLKAFCAYFKHRRENGNPITDTTWTTLTTEEFDEFRVGDFYAYRTATIPYQGAGSGGIGGIPVPVREFRRGIRRDITQFIALKDDGAWDNWHRSLVAQARAQDVAEVINPAYKPNTSAEKQLFDEKQKFMYAVFEKALLTDKGKSLVRAHQCKYDAQTIFKELSDYALKSTKAVMDASALFTYMTSTKLGDGSWKGTTHAFILHWTDQVRKYNDLSPNQKIGSDLQRTMLENCVSPIAALRAVKDQADQHRIHSKQDLSLSQYMDLLLSAAQQYDKQFMQQTTRNPRRRIYEHETEFEFDGEHYSDAESYSIDVPVSTISAFAATSMTRAPRLSRDQWYSLTKEAQTTWDQLSDEAKSVILNLSKSSSPSNHNSNHNRPNRRQFPPAKPRRQVNAHDIQHLLECLQVDTATMDDSTLVTACLHARSEGSQHEFETANEFQNSDVTSMNETCAASNDGINGILAHVTKRKPLPPGNIKRLMSPTANNAKGSNSTGKPTAKEPNEININGVTYRSVCMANI